MPPLSEKLITRIHQVMARGQVDAAEIALFQTIGEDAPPEEAVRADLLLATACRAAGNDAAAGGFLERAIERMDDPGAWALWLLDQEEFALAEPAALAATKSASPRLGDWLALGLARLGQDHAAGAVAPFEKAVAADPAHGDARYYLATALARAEQPREAVGHLEVLLRAQPRHAGATRLRALLAFALGDHRQAAMELAKAIALGAAEPELFYHLAEAREQAGDVAGAIQALEELVAGTPSAWEAYIRLGRLAGKAGRTAEARKYLQAASYMPEWRAEALRALDELKKAPHSVPEVRPTLRPGLPPRPTFNKPPR